MCAKWCVSFRHHLKLGISQATSYSNQHDRSIWILREAARVIIPIAVEKLATDEGVLHVHILNPLGKLFWTITFMSPSSKSRHAHNQVS